MELPRLIELLLVLFLWPHRLEIVLLQDAKVDNAIAKQLELLVVEVVKRLPIFIIAIKGISSEHLVIFEGLMGEGHSKQVLALIREIIAIVVQCPCLLVDAYLNLRVSFRRLYLVRNFVLRPELHHLLDRLNGVLPLIFFLKCNLHLFE